MSMIRDGKGEVIDETNPLRTKVTTDDIIPVDIQARLAQTIQTHNAVSVAAGNVSAQSAFMDLDGFDKIALTLLNDGATNSSALIYWSNDGSTIHGNETIIANATAQQKQGILDIKARYAKVVLSNGDGALAHIMSAWVLLKA
jgi:hypothetical protein